MFAKKTRTQWLFLQLSFRLKMQTLFTLIFQQDFFLSFSLHGKENIKFWSPTSVAKRYLTLLRRNPGPVQQNCPLISLFLMVHSRPLFLYFRLFDFDVHLVDNILPMLGFEPQISGVGSNHSTNKATTTALHRQFVLWVLVNSEPCRFLPY